MGGLTFNQKTVKAPVCVVVVPAGLLEGESLAPSIFPVSSSLIWKVLRLRQEETIIVFFFLKLGRRASCTHSPPGFCTAAQAASWLAFFFVLMAVQLRDWCTIDEELRWCCLSLSMLVVNSICRCWCVLCTRKNRRAADACHS